MSWQERGCPGCFASFPPDGDHLLAAARYVELNPLCADLVKRPAPWPWSSAAAHLDGRSDRLLGEPPPLPDMVGDEAFVARLEATLGPTRGDASRDRNQPRRAPHG